MNLDRLKFWKKEKDPFPTGLGEFNPPTFDPQPTQPIPPLGAQAPQENVPGWNPTPTAPPQPAYPMPSPRPFPQHEPIQDRTPKDMEVVNLKLDAIKNALESINMRLERIENHLSQKQPQPKQWYR